MMNEEKREIAPNHRWQDSMKWAFRDWKDLSRYLELDGISQETIDLNPSRFPLFVTREFASRMRKGDLRDPLLLQVLPDVDESVAGPLESFDPVGDGDSVILPGLLQKYHGRVLLIATSACAVHCRYCFRQFFPYEQAPKAQEDWMPAIDYLRRDTSIEEVILSGGDPLTLVDSKLSWLVHQMDSIPHLTRLRIHTRLPVMIPSRVDEGLSQWLKETRLAKWMVLHVNHPQEIDASVEQSIRRLQGTGTMLLNQAVLLRGVNDSSAVLASLCRRLIDLGVLPYYLHQMDPVRGASRFEVPIEEGLRIVDEMRGLLPGYAVPRYVAEIPGEPSKTALSQSLLELPSRLT